MDSQGRAMPITLISNDTGMPLQAEFKGDLIEVTYAIEILAKIDYTPSIGLEMPVRIYHSAAAPPAAYTPAALPIGSMEWSPQVSQSIDIPIASVTPSAPTNATTPYAVEKM